MKDRSKQRQTTVTVVHKFKVLVYTVIPELPSYKYRSAIKLLRSSYQGCFMRSFTTRDITRHASGRFAT